MSRSKKQNLLGKRVVIEEGKKGKVARVYKGKKLTCRVFGKSSKSVIKALKEKFHIHYKQKIKSSGSTQL